MDFASPQVHKSGNQLHVTHGSDEGLYVEFEKVPIQNNFKTEQEGRPIFDDVDYIKITFPGDKTKQVHRPVNKESSPDKPSDLHRFPQQWARYEASESQVESGTPITEWAVITKSQAQELKAIHIHTVEALASIPDVSLTWMGSRGLRDKAKLWLENAKDGAVVTAMKAENDTLRSDMEMLKQQIKELSTLKIKKDKE